MIETNELFRCTCHSMEHIMVVSHFDDDEEVYVSIHLAPLPWYKRIVNAIKYIFGHRSPYGDFEEMILSHKDWEGVQAIADTLKGNAASSQYKVVTTLMKEKL